FREAFNREAAERLRGYDLRPEIAADLEIALEEISDSLQHYLQYLGPFGVGNPRPVFLTRHLSVEGEARIVGHGHLKLRLSQQGRAIDGIAFRLAERLGSVAAGQVDITFHLHEHRYRGARHVQAKILDLHTAAS
ncbi:MAG: single-stranded-DNA-specific exonuclease RecJ, partial [Gemmatimonadetes bacterium]|nr:single-stranded-DNA-specific exonuclease RecJ [Gemmatimonadota bacterium]